MCNVHSTTPSLLLRCADLRDREAWREFDERYRELLLRFCCRRGVPYVDAEDLVQRIFASLTQTLSDFAYDPRRGRFRDYLYRCARNEISKWSARPNRRDRALDSNDGTPDGRDDGETTWQQEWVAHHYRTAMRTVRDTFDEKSVAIFDRSIGGAKVADLAREFAMSEQAVHKVRQRIRDRMEELIAEQVREEDEIRGE